MTTYNCVFNYFVIDQTTLVNSTLGFTINSVSNYLTLDINPTFLEVGTHNLRIEVRTLGTILN